MSLSSSLNAGVQGLSVNSTRLSAISDNIVNSNTNGFKRVLTEFSSIAIDNSVESRYTAGGVRAFVKRDITAVGTLESTNNSTDIAISGNGFFATTPTTNPSNFNPLSQSVHLRTTGSFAADSEGFLKNQNGDYLLGWELESDGTTTVASPSRNTTAHLKTINSQRIQFNSLPTSKISLSGPLPANATKFGADIADNTVIHTEEYFNTIGNSEILTYRFTPQPSTTIGTSSNIWDLEIYDSATTTNGGLLGKFWMQFQDASDTQSGSITSLTPVDTDLDGTPDAPATYDAHTGIINLETATTSINSFIGSALDYNGITQTGALTEASIRLDSKDGSSYGEFQGVEIDDNGIVSAFFSNDQFRPIYQIPIITMANPNDLEALSAQGYALTNESGAMSLGSAGENSSGKIINYALTKSTVDIAQELTQLIETQRAYSSNAKIIQTVDEMLQETTNIKR
jgi:flagellar hook protein FlgE